ncbi:hypothetical protein AOC05_10475 [Arthrobacter alpinus]|uniref:Uncharacterized protein n=1 Tax=Arthrobacter alpinus TaxID=656366 RepID=A0A0M4RP91_9MICC|nr:hypothetical protein AOC05_10475 [Arthrobacter alpinus]
MGKATVSAVDANSVQTTTEAAVSIDTSLQPALPSAATKLAAVHSATSSTGASVSWEPTDDTAAGFVGATITTVLKAVPPRFNG